MNSPVRFALIGCGRIAPKHVAAFAKVPQEWLACVCDLVASEAEAIDERLDVLWYTEYRDILEQKPIDVMNVCTESGKRGSVESLGVTLLWNASNGCLDLRLGTRIVKMRIGRSLTTVDGRNVRPLVEPVVTGATTPVPLRFIGNSLNCVAGWGGPTKRCIANISGLR